MKEYTFYLYSGKVIVVIADTLMDAIREARLNGKTDQIQWVDVVTKKPKEGNK